MRDPLIQSLCGVAEIIVKHFDTAKQAREPLRELLELLDQTDVSKRGRWVLPDRAQVDELEVLGAIWLAFGVGHPANRVLAFPASTGKKIVVEEDLSGDLWQIATDKYPPVLLKAMAAGEDFSPENLFEGQVIETEDGKRAAHPASAYMASAFCNLCYLSLADAALGDRAGLDSKMKLLELMIQRNIYIIGFTDNSRTVLVPVRG